MFNHKHIVTYTRSVSSGWSDPSARYGATHGTCRDCGQPIVQRVEEGMTAATNWHPFRTHAERNVIEAAHTEALAMTVPSGPRVVWHADESFYDAAHDAYVVAEITEGEAGYRKVRLLTTLEAATLAASAWNAEHGHTADDVIDVRLSSMSASGILR